MRAPLNATVAAFRRPLFVARDFLAPRQIVDLRVEMPAPPRSYPLLTAEGVSGYCKPWDMALNQKPHDFSAPIQTSSPPLRGRVIYRDALGDIWRHVSPCQRMAPLPL